MKNPMPEDTVEWAYRMLLGREPESEDAIQGHIRLNQPFSVEKVRIGFMQTTEFATQVRKLVPSHQRPGMLALEPYRDPVCHSSEAGFFRDLVGVKTRTAYLPDYFAKFGGMVPGDFEIDMLPLHDDVELFSMAHAFRSSGKEFVVMELGAGWGPWISMGGAMARNKSRAYRLIAVEAATSHYEFLKMHMYDNSFDPKCCRLIHGIIGVEDGKTRFPKTSHEDYGISFANINNHTGDFEEVDCWKIATLLDEEPVVDILHCDIQGYEVPALTASIDAIDCRVRRVLIGTHGRGIEEELFRLFEGRGWSLEMDDACRVRSMNGKAFVFQDGAQLWLNPKLF